MDVRTRIDDAKFLSDDGRKEGAFTQILLAFAATARKRYPQYVPGQRQNTSKEHRPLPGEPAHDNIGFKSFVLDELDKITGGPKYNVVLPFKGKNVPFEAILYEHVRNAAFHESSTPNVSFTERVFSHGQLQNVLRLNDPIGIPEMWFWNMARVVALAPENRPLFDDYEINKNWLS